MDTTFLGLTAGALTTVGFIPQIIKSLRTKKVNDVSLLQPAVLLTGMALWLVYGLLIGDLAIMAANGISLLLNAWLILLKIRYRQTT